jgi:CO/xanthine dehydrogenase Mo-binding subunit
MSRIADVIGIDPWEFRLKNANRIGDTSGNGVVLKDPSTVPVTLAAAERVGLELPAGLRRMTSDPRSDELLPEHLVAQQRSTGEES